VKTVAAFLIILCLFISCNSKDSVSAPIDHQNKMSHYEKFTIGSKIRNGDIGEDREWKEVVFINGIGTISWNDGEQILPVF